MTAELPVGVKVFKVADQPEVVKDAVSGFTEALFEAVIIVLAVSFVSLGGASGFCRFAFDPAGVESPSRRCL